MRVGIIGLAIVLLIGLSIVVAVGVVLFIVVMGRKGKKTPPGEGEE